MINSSSARKNMKNSQNALHHIRNRQEKFEGQIPSRNRDIFLVHVVPMSNWLFLYWSVYCMFVDKSCTESYPSYVDALQKFRVYYLTES